MTEYRYSAAAVNGDLARAAIGLALCSAPIVLVSLQPWLILLLTVPAGLFALFGARTWLRRGLRITVDDNGIAASGPAATQIAWRNLERFKLSYFSTRRDRSNGWMQLSLRGPTGRLSVDSGLDGFDEVCQRAFHAATENEIDLSGATLRNLAELGLVSELGANLHPSGSTGWGNPADWRR